MKRMQRLVARVLLIAAALCTCASLPLAAYAEEPVERIGSQNVVQVELGNRHSAAITEDGSLWMWGGNDAYQLGDGTNHDRSTPVKILDNIVDVSLGVEHSAAIDTDGVLWCWGKNTSGQIGVESGTYVKVPTKVMDHVKSVSLGYAHSAAIKEDGTLWMWGRNWAGELGVSHEDVSLRVQPAKVMDDVVSIALGSNVSAAIKEDGSLWTWGYWGSRTLGDDSTRSRSTPVKILDGISSVDFGLDHGAALTIGGQLLTWGWNRSGELGEGKTQHTREIPQVVMDGIASFSLGSSFSSAIDKNGTLWTWGSNLAGQLGNGTTEGGFERNRVMGDAASVSLGSNFAAAIKEDGSLWTWGYNGSGQLGDGTTEDHYEPVKITLGNSTTTIPGQVTHYYGTTYIPADPEEQIQYLAKNLHTAMDDYLTAVRDAAEDDSKVLLKEAKKKTKGQMLKEMDLASDAKILTLEATAPETAVDAAYEALAMYLDEYVDAAEELGDIDMSGELIEISADIVNEVRNNTRIDNLTVRSGGYTVTFKVTGWWFAYFGDVTVRGSGRESYTGAIVSSPDETAEALNRYVGRLADWTEDALYQAMNSIFSDFGKVTGISDFTDKMMREAIEDKVDVLRQRGFGDLLVFCQAMRDGYEIAEPLLDDSEEGFSEALGDAIYIYNKIKDIDYSDSAVTNKIVSAAMNKVDNAKKSLVTALYDYLYETEEGQGSYSGWDEFWANPGDAIMGWFKCPVDITVYSADGSVLGKIENNRVVTCSEGIFLKTEGDMKGVAILKGTEARIVTTATGEGSMTVMVEQYGGGAPTGRAVYREVPLTMGGSYTLEFPTGDMSASSTPSLVPDGGGAVSGQFVSADDEDANINITAVATAGGECSGSGTYPIGEPVALVARPQDGYSFSGWYLNGELVGFSTTYCLSALDDTSVEARFEPERTVDKSIEITLAEDYGSAASWAYEADAGLSDLVISMAGIEGIDGPDYILRSYDGDGTLVSERRETSVNDGAWRREIRAVDLKGYGTVELLTTDGKLILTVGDVLVSTEPEDPSEPVTPDTPADPDGPSHEETCPSLDFSDIDVDQWYHESVDWALDNEVMNGYAGTDLFGPDDALPREQAAAVLYNALAGGATGAPETDRADVDQNEWYAEAVNWAVEEGVMNGYAGTDRFGVGDPLTREQFACVLANAVDAKLAADPDALDAFGDAGFVSDWAATALAWAVDEGVLNGVEMEDGSRELQPCRDITRAEMAAMMKNAVDAGVLTTA